MVSALINGQRSTGMTVVSCRGSGRGWMSLLWPLGGLTLNTNMGISPRTSWWFSKMGKWWFTPVDEASENPQVFSMCCDASKAHQTSMKTSARLCRISFIMFCIFLKYTDACFVQASQKLLTKVWREARVKDGKIGPQEQWKQFQDSSGRISNNCTQYSVLCLSGASPIHIQGEQALHSDSQP